TEQAELREAARCPAGDTSPTDFTSETATRTVLHLRTVTGRGGGPEKTLLNSHRFIGPRYHLLLGYLHPANDPEYDMPERARAAGATLIDLPERGPLDWRAVRKLIGV